MITLYKASKIVNEILADNDLPLIPPQMMYNYSRNNLIKTYLVDGKKVVDEKGTDNKDFGMWLVRYLTKKGVVMNEGNENQVALF